MPIPQTPSPSELFLRQTSAGPINSRVWWEWLNAFRRGFVAFSEETSLSAFYPDVRLTLTSGVAVTEADVLGATVVYCTSMGRAGIPILDASGTWVRRPFTDDLQLFLHPTFHLAAHEYSIFAFWDEDTLALGTGPAWPTATSPGTGLGSSEIVIVAGLPVNKFDITLTNSNLSGVVPANEALLLGGIATSTISGQTEDSYAKRLLSNYFNPTLRPMRRYDPANGWTIFAGSTTFHQANDNPLNQLEFFFIGGGRSAMAMATSMASNGSNLLRAAGVGIALDATNTVDPNSQKGQMQVDDTRIWGLPPAIWRGSPGQGRHRLVWIEWAGTPPNASNDDRFFVGDSNNNLVVQTGISGEVLN